MPQLPSPTVTDEQAATILEAYKSKYGTTTTAETATAFKREVLEMVKRTVLDYEAQKMLNQQNEARSIALKNLEIKLPKPEDAQ